MDFVSLRDAIYASPKVRTAIPVVLSVGLGVFSNLLVTEMTLNGEIVWGSFYKTISFYAVLAFAYLTYRFHKGLYAHETEVERFKDADYCNALALSQLMPVHLAHAKAAIARGDTRRFALAMAQVKKILK